MEIIKYKLNNFLLLEESGKDVSICSFMRQKLLAEE